MKLSVITPIYNEEENIARVLTDICTTLEAMHTSWEIIAVDDGSSDQSYERLEEIARIKPQITVVRLARNFGQTAAIQAAIDVCKGEIIVPIDADGQNDPKDIPKLVAKLEEGYGLVSGWRVDRQDHKIKRNFVSQVANSLISWVSGVRLHDYGCSLKAYRREIVEPVKLYGEMHRFIPIYASWYGGKITEMPVGHHPRIAGTSKYGLNRIFKVVLDLLVVKFLHGPLTKPIYWFGGVGLTFLAISILALCGAMILKLASGVSFILTPLPLIGFISFTLFVLCLLCGLLAELLVRVYFEAQGKRTYVLKTVYSQTKQDDSCVE